MRAILGWAVVGSAIWMAGACAGHAPRPEHATAASASGSAGGDKSGRREVTWAEYYTEIAERARRRGIMVIWVSPPALREATAHASNAR
jgi:hypothetical protein